MVRKAHATSTRKTKYEPSDALSKLRVRRPSPHGGYGWVRDLPDERDFVYAAPLIRFPHGLPPSVDLRSECPPIYDQGQLGSCTGNGIAYSQTTLLFTSVQLRGSRARVPSK